MPWTPFLISLIVTIAVVPPVRRLAAAWGVLDVPDGVRHRHDKPIPLLGGLAVFAAIAAVALAFRGSLLGGFLLGKHLAGILLGGLILVLGGALDDRYRLKPWQQLAFPALASLVVIAAGVGVGYVTNPFGGLVRLDLWTVRLFAVGGVPYHLTLPGDLFTFAWLMIMSYTTKLLDGVDGLVSGLTVVGAAVIALLALTPEVGQPELASFAAIVAGAFAGFLAWNRPPARVFLGEGGSTLAGWLLGVMAVLAGAKIGVTLLIMAVPLMDLAWTVIRRMTVERRPLAQGDRGHLHQRLVDSGLSPLATIFLYWSFAAGFGGVGLFIRGREKLLALVLLAALFVAVTVGLRLRDSKRRTP